MRGYSEVPEGLIDPQGIGFDFDDGQTLDKLFECAPTDMLGPNRAAHNTRVVPWTDQKRKSFHGYPQHLQLLGGAVQAKGGSREELTNTTDFRPDANEGAFLLSPRNTLLIHGLWRTFVMKLYSGGGLFTQTLPRSWA